MQFFVKNILLAVVVLALSPGSIKADLRQCADFDNRTYSEIFLYQNEWNHLFDEIDNNDTQLINQISQALSDVGRMGIDELDSTDYKSSPIKFVPDRIEAEGYPSEVHEVVTDDGYILQLHRIPYGKKSPQTDKFRPPILLMHPYEESSSGWIVLGPDHSIAYLLADAGYDVWMGNVRGTEVSRRHVRLNPNGKEYWSFSLHEIGIYDLSAFIDHILNVTKQTKLNYIGYSQGGTSFFILMSMRPEYNDKIIEAQLMAPAVYFKVINNRFFRFLKRFYTPLKTMLSIAHIHKLALNNEMGTNIVKTACGRATQRTPLACKLVMTLMDSNQINCTSMTSIAISTPAGASVQQSFHYIQFMRSGGFNQFDYDSKRINKRMYGTETPPPYNLTRITTPLNLYYSKGDQMVEPQNIIELQSHLKSLKSSYVVPIDDFNHVDFIYSRYLRKAVNDKVIRNINEVNGK